MLKTSNGLWQTPVFEMSDNIYLKLENLNLGGSHKVRAARWMLKDALEKGLTKDNTIIEKTGGNLGIGLAIETNKLGIDLELAVGNSFSKHKKILMENYGAKLIGKDMMNNGLQPVDVIEYHLSHQKELGKKYVYLDQFNNTANLTAHIEETGQEILDFIVSNNLQNNDIHIVGGIGTGASLCGIALALKEKIINLTIVGVQPEGCDIENEVFIDHDLQGLAVGVKPAILRSELIDYYISVPEDKALVEKKWLLEKHGIFCGNSTGANIFAVKELASKKSNISIFSLVYDNGDSYID